MRLIRFWGGSGKNMKLELMDWKKIEKESTESLHNAMANVEVASILLAESEKRIRSFGGTTQAEIDKAFKKSSESGR